LETHSDSVSEGPSNDETDVDISVILIVVTGNGKSGA
jgi:hypothetical protein